MKTEAGFSHGILYIIVFYCVTFVTAQTERPVELDPAYQWKLDGLYMSRDAWRNDYDLLSSKIEELKQYETTAVRSGRDLLNCLRLNESLQKGMGKLFLYAELLHLQDQRNDDFAGMYADCRQLSSRLNAAFAFFSPALLSVSDARLNDLLSEKPALKGYSHYLLDIRERSGHTLSNEAEEILSQASILEWYPFTIFSSLTGSDLPFPEIADENGHMFTVNRSRNYTAMFSTDRNFRKRSYEAFLASYARFTRTFSSMLSAHVQTQIFMARARNYSSVLEANLAPEHIPVSVYDNLIKTINNNLTVLQRWGTIKKQVLRYDTMYPYDTYVTIFPASKKIYSFEEAKEMALQALAPLGEEYVRNFSYALDHNWVDVFERQGKSAGGMCRARFGADHPYVLLNFSGDLQDVFTFIHEMGHAMYRHYSFTHQNYYHAYYSSFTSEVAAILNETLLSDYLIEHAESSEEMMALIEERIYRFQLDFFQMSRTAEFEKMMYERVEKGESLTTDGLSSLYKDLYRRYWGGIAEPDSLIQYKWAVWPHMYFTFYIYQYGTSLAAAEQIAAGLKSQGSAALARYLEFLKRGSADYPILLLQSAGVDMSSPRPVVALVDKMNDLLDTLETLIDDHIK